MKESRVSILKKLSRRNLLFKTLYAALIISDELLFQLLINLANKKSNLIAPSFVLHHPAPA